MKRHSILLTMLCLAACAMAAPVKNMPVMRIQPKGDTLHCLVTGDEFYHRLHDAQDYTIIQNIETGWYVYAAEEDGVLVPTQYVPGSVDPASVGLKPGVMPCAAELRKMHDAWNIPPQYQLPESKTSGRNHGMLNNIVIFIRFSDENSCTSDPFSTINNKFNDSSATASSLYSYFKVDSYNKLSVITHFYPAPSGSMVMSYQDSHPRGYYEPYSSTNTVGYQESERTNREFTLLENAVNWINTNSPISNSLNLDIDNDGKVDNICFIVSGSNNGWNDLLWPHKWSLYDRTVNINGKRVWTFNLQLAGAGDHYFGVSTLCHEMTHTLGVPDLYHYNNYSSVSPAGSWDLMHSNATPPQQTNSLHKLKYLNWFDSIPQLVDSGDYTMQSLASGPNHAYKIASANPHQWYILEYRNNTDRFDESIPNRGMLIWRYNDQAPADNAGFNNTDTLHELWLFRPNSTADTINGTIAQAAFGVSGRTAFGPSTNPHPYLCDATADTSFSITNIAISGNGQSVSFTFTPRGGSACSPINTLPYNEGFESGDMDCWTFASIDPTNDGRVGVYSASTVTPFTGTYAFRFSSYSSASDYNQYLISPRLQMNEPMQFTFFYQRAQNGWSESFSVKYSTTNNRPESFTNTITSLTANVNYYQQCSVMVPANAKYVAINYNNTSDKYYLWIDDISLTNAVIHDTTYVHIHDTLTRIEYDTVFSYASDTVHYTMVDTLPNIIYDTTIVSHSYGQLMVVSNQPSRGKVVGSGTFLVGSEVKIAALARRGYRFHHWTDGDTTNPRNVRIINGNQIFNAFFVVNDTSQTTLPPSKTLVHDTIEVHDTTWITLRDTLRLTQHDTVWIPFDQHDTLWIDTHVPFDYDTLTYYILTVEAHSMVPNPGWTCGSGRYPAGTVVEIGAMLNSEWGEGDQGVYFLDWSGDVESLYDSDNNTRFGTAKVTLVSDTYVHAIFGDPGAVDQPLLQSMAKIYTQGSTLVVEAESVSRVAVYNVMGQQVYAGNTQRAEVNSLPAGVYLVRVADSPAKKVVIVR